MAKRKDVGTSWHTQAKHALMREFVAREVRAANELGWLERMVWIDLTAGDGIPSYDAEWHEACSPGILAYQAATTRRKQVVIVLHEKDPTTYGKLIASLDANLPMLGYIRHDAEWWRIGGKVWLRALNADGRTATTDYLKPKDAVLVLNDPNSITEWAMRQGFMAEILRRPVKGLRILSTLGCNTCGEKRLPFSKPGTLSLGDGPEVMSPKERKGWFALLEEQQSSLPQRHDLLLAAFERDSAQWAYLLTTPRLERWYGEAETDARKAFATVGRMGELAFFRRTPEQFEVVKERLFLTKSERFERANTPLPLEGSEGDRDPPYRRHPRFLAVRAVVFERAGGLCERCKSRPPTEPHHLRYPPWGTFDVPENMIAVCHPCHCEIHGKAA